MNYKEGDRIAICPFCASPNIGLHKGYSKTTKQEYITGFEACLDCKSLWKDNTNERTAQHGR